MRENTYQIEVGDYERRTLIGILAECRNECLKRETPTEDVNNLLEKALDAPLKKKKGKDRDHKLRAKMFNQFHCQRDGNGHAHLTLTRIHNFMGASVFFNRC